MSVGSAALGALLRAVVVAVGLLPWRALGWGGEALGLVAGSVLRIRRTAVVTAMDRAAIAAPEVVATRMYAGLGTSLLELLWLAAASPSRRARAVRERMIVEPELTRALRDARARGPVVLAASHTANWELVAFKLAESARALGVGFGVVVKPISVGVFHAFCTRLRVACGVQLLPPEGALARGRALLARGDLVAMVVDQVPDRTRHGLRVPFLGAPALADRSPAALARSAGATVLVIAASRGERAQDPQRLRLLLEVAPSDVPAATWVADATVGAQEALDAFVRRHPSSWLWLHRRWREPLSARRNPSLVAHRQPG